MRGVYLSVFALAALVCFASVVEARGVSDRDTRTGLVALLLLSGTWAVASAGRLLPFPADVQMAFYTVGLVVGLATVGAWLYFCSAYTGHDYHRRRPVQVTALVMFVTVVAVKVTNPLHNLYYEVGTAAADPFVHTVFELGAVHWVVTGLAYALTAIGFYLLYELFSASHFDTRPLAALMALTAVPAVVDVAAYTELLPTVLIKANYEPLGVAAFAVGTLFVVDERFNAVPQFWRESVLESLEEAVIVLDGDRRIRDYNAAASRMYPDIDASIRAPLSEVAPDLAAFLDSDPGKVFDHTVGGRTKFYRARTTSLSTAGAGGLAVICADVTDIERQRRDLERHADQFDDFAEAITHELRNAVTIVDGYLDLVATQIGEDPDRDAEVPIEQVNEGVTRMRDVIAELTTLARYGQPIDEAGECRVGAAVETAWARGGYDAISYEVTADGMVRADDNRLTELFAAAFGFAVGNGATSLSVHVADDEIRVADDGDPLPSDAVPKAFAYGEPVPSGDAGMALPNLRMLARGLGWSVDVDERYREGVAIRLSGVDVVRSEPERRGE